MRQSGEPSVEEILESIKQVIARDNRVGAAEIRRQRETDGMTAAAAHGRDPVDEDADEQCEDVLDLSASAEYLQDAADRDDSGEDLEPGEEAPLLRNETRSSMRESLAALALLSQPGMQPQIVRSGETSLEGMVRELLRPALADWLEKNLPPLVERLVAEEIRRISQKKG